LIVPGRQRPKPHPAIAVERDSRFGHRAAHRR
jgi:hypothetical protein